MIILKTKRLILRQLINDDANFILKLVNDPDWLHYIGDKNVHNLDDACDYINNGPGASYKQNGFGLYLASLKENDSKIGLCGLIKRDVLDHPDVGFAFLPAFRNQGYAKESAAAVLVYGKDTLGIDRILAITATDNETSGRVLEKIGLHFEKIIKISDDDPGSKLFVPMTRPKVKGIRPKD